MSGLTSALHLAYLTAVALTTGVGIATIPVPGLAKWGRGLAVLSAVLGLVSLGVRTAASGHLPLFGTFENTAASAWFLMAASSLAVVTRSRYRDIWRMASPWALALLVYGSRFRSTILPLTISEKSVLVDVHVALAWVAFTALLGSSTLSFMRLLGKHPLDLRDDESDLLLDRLLLAGFLALTGMMALGSWYLYVLFATFWKWEIVEVCSLIAWLGYGLVLHLRLFYRRRGRAIDVWIVLLLPMLLLAFWVWSLFPDTFHFFDIPLMRPY